MRNGLLNIFLLYLIFCFTSGSPLKAQTLRGDLEARFTKAEDIQLFVDSLERNKIVLLNSSPDSVRKFFLSISNICKQNGWNDEYNRVSFLLSESLIRLGADFDNLLLSTYEGIDNALVHKDSHQLSRHYYILGRLYDGLKQYESALKYLKLAVDHAKKTENLKDVQYFRHTLSTTLYKAGLFNEAMLLLQESINSAEKKDDINNPAYIGDLELLMLSYVAIKEYDSANIIIKKLPDLAKGNTMPYEWITLYTNIGDALLRQGKYSEAAHYYNLALKIYEKENINYRIGHLLTRIAYVYELLGDYDMQLEYNRQALQSRMIHSSPTFVGSSYANIANSFLNTGQTDSALIFLKKAYGIHKKSGMIDRYLPNDCDKLYQLYRDIGQSDSALKYYIEYKNSTDSLQELNNKQTLQAITYEWKFKEKRLKFEQEEKDNRAEALVLYILLILVLLILIIVFLVIVQLKQKSRQQQMVMRDKVMRLQLNPHFLFNSLIAIQGYVYQNKAELAGEYLSSYAKLMRLFLNNSRSDFISIDVEIETLTNYLQLQTIRFRDKFEFNIHIDPQIDKDNILIPSGLAQPFIENAIEHGLQEKLSRGTIDVRFFINGSSLHIEIEDDGIGVHHSKKSSKNQKHLSLSTLITRERIENLSRRGKAKIHFTINEVNPEADEPGTIVTFILPVQYKSDASKK